MHENKFSRRTFLASIPAAAATLALTGCSTASSSSSSSGGHKVLIVGSPDKSSFSIYNSKGKRLATVDGVIPALFSSDIVSVLTKDYIIIERDNKRGFCDLNGKIILEPVYDDVTNFFEGSTMICQNGLYGYADETGNIFIEPQFSKAFAFSSGLAAVMDSTYHWGYIDQTGSYVIPSTLPVQPGFFCGDFAPYDRLYEHGGGVHQYLIDRSGNIIDSLYNSVVLIPSNQFEFHNGYAAVTIPDPNDILKHTQGFINEAGELCFTDKSFSSVFNFSNGRAIVYPSDRSGFKILDTDGNYLTTAGFLTDFASYHNGMLYATIEAENNDWKQVFLDLDGQIAFEIPEELEVYKSDPFFEYDHVLIRNKILDKKGNIKYDFTNTVNNYGEVLYACTGGDDFVIYESNTERDFVGVTTLKGKEILKADNYCFLGVIDLDTGLTFSLDPFRVKTLHLPDTV